MRKVSIARFLLAAVIVAVCCILPSCENNPGAPQEPKKTVLPVSEVYVNIGPAESKALSDLPMPDPKSPITSSHDSYYAKFLVSSRLLSDVPADNAGISGVMTDREVARSEAGPVVGISLGKMTQGEWEFDVRAVNAAGDILYREVKKTYIAASNASNSLNFALAEYNENHNASLQFDLVSLGIAEPRLVINIAKQGTGESFHTIADTSGDDMGIQMINAGKGYYRYCLENLLMPSSGAYRLQVLLYNGNELFAGTILDTWALPGKAVLVSGGFDISGNAVFVRVTSGETVKFTDCAKICDTPVSKIITGYTILGTDIQPDFPYSNTGSDTVYLIPVFEDFGKYFTMTEGKVSAKDGKASTLKYVGMAHGYSGSPTGFGDSVFENGSLRAVYAEDVKTVGTKTFMSSSLEDCLIGVIESIGPMGFASTPLKKITGLSDYISIGDGAFLSSGLTDFQVPLYATLGTGVFRGSLSLATVHYGIKDIPGATFSGCTSLSSVTLASGVKTIGNEAFLGCSALEKLEIKGVETIGAGALRDSGIKGTLNIGSDIKTIGSNAFAGMNSTEEIFIDRHNGDVEGHPWGADPESKITYGAYKLYFNGNIDVPDGPDDKVVFPRITEKNGKSLPGIGIEDPLFRYVAYNRAVGDTIDGYPLPIPIRDGYGFKGWYSKPTALKQDLVSQLTMNTTKGDWTVYAGWIKGVMTLVFNPGKNSADDMGATSEFYRMVRFNENYGRKAGDEPEEDINPAPLPTAADTKVPGRTFIGWYLSAEPWLASGYPDEATQKSMGADLITNDRVVATKKGHVAYAHYRDHRYPLVFNNGLTVPDGIISIGGSAVTASGYPAIPGGTVKFNYPLSVRWNSSPASSSYEGQTGVALPDLNSMKGYALDYYYHEGWCYDKAVTSKATASDRVRALATDGADYTLYAKWIGKEVKVNFVSVEPTAKFNNYNSEYTWGCQTITRTVCEPIYVRYRGTYSVRPSSTNWKDSMLDRNVSLPGASREGYTFGGWFSEVHGLSDYTDGTVSSIGKQIHSLVYVAEDERITDATVVGKATEHTLYAKWIPNTYTVTLDPKGGTVGTTKLKVTYNNTYPDLPTPVKPGYMFAGWYTTDDRTTGYGYENAENKKHVLPSTVVTTASDHTLYAAWVSVGLTYSSVNYYSQNLKLTATLNIDPNAAGYYGSGTTNTGSGTYQYKGYSYPTRKGQRSGTLDEATWSDSNDIDYVPYGQYTVSATLKAGNQNGLSVSAQNNNFTATTSGGTVPANSVFELKTNYHGNLGTATADITVACRGKLNSIALSGATSVSATHTHTYTATLASDASGVPTHWTQRRMIFSVTNNDGWDYMGTGTDKTLEFTSTTADVSASVHWGYALNTRTLKVTSKDGSKSATLSVKVSQPPDTVKIENGNSPEFYTMVSTVYTANATAKENWVITDFAKYNDGNKTTYDDFENQYNGTGHNEYYYPIHASKDGYYSDEDSWGNSYSFRTASNTKYLAVPHSAKDLAFIIGTGDTSYPNVKKLYCGSRLVVADKAFMGNTTLSSMKMTENGYLSKAGDYSFQGCKNLKFSSDGLTLQWTHDIRSHAFDGCTGLSGSINFSNATHIGDYAFASTKITDISVNQLYCYIGSWVFNGCDTLTKLNLSCQTIGDNAFNGLGTITAVSLANTTSIGAGAFANAGTFEISTFPDTLSSLGNTAFKDCTEIKSMTFPAATKTFGDSCFEGCTKLASAKFNSTEAITIGKNAFSGCTALETVDFLTLGTNFNNSTIGENTWKDCKLRFVKIARGNFGSEAHICWENGNTDCNWDYYDNIRVRYYRDSCVQFFAQAWGGGWGWFMQYNAHAKVKYQTNYPGGDEVNLAGQATYTISEYVSGLVIWGGAGNYDHNWEGSFSRVTAYDLNHENSATAWDYVVKKEYKFCGAPALFQSEAYDTSVYCNDYVYPGSENLENLMAID